MLNGIQRLWRGWRERRLARAGPHEDENPPAPEDEPAQPAAEAGVPGGGLARRIKSHVRIGVLRRVDRLPSLRISRPRPPTYHIMPAEMQNVPHTPLPLARYGPQSVPTGEFVEGEAVSSQDTSAAAPAADDAAWDALWALRGTPSISAHPVRSTPVSSSGQAELPPEASAPSAAPGMQRALPQSGPRPPLQTTPPAVGRPAVPVSRPSAVERTQTSLPQPPVAPLPVEHPESDAQPAPVSLESTALAGQKAAQPAAPPLNRPAIARRKADLTVRPVASRVMAASPAATTASSALEYARPLEYARSPIQTRRPLVDQPPIFDQQATEHPLPPTVKSRPPLVASLRAGLQRLGLLRREQIPGPADEERPAVKARPLAAPRPIDAVQHAPSLASPRPAVQSAIARQPADSASPPTVHPVPEQPQLTPAPTWAARPVARRLADSVSPFATAAGATPQISRAAQMRPHQTFEPVASGLAVQESPVEEPQPAKDETVAESPAVETAPPEQSARERTIERPLEEPLERPEAQESPLALQPQVGKWPDFMPSETPSAEPFAAQPEQDISRPIPSAVSPIAPAASGTHTVQRTIRDAQDLAQVLQPSLSPMVVQTAPEILAQPAEAAPAASGEQAGGQAHDLEAISRQVYQIIRRRMVVERERERGR